MGDTRIVGSHVDIGAVDLGLMSRPEGRGTGSADAAVPVERPIASL